MIFTFCCYVYAPLESSWCLASPCLLLVLFPWTLQVLWPWGYNTARRSNDQKWKKGKVPKCKEFWRAAVREQCIPSVSYLSSVTTDTVESGSGMDRVGFGTTAALLLWVVCCVHHSGTWLRSWTSRQHFICYLLGCSWHVLVGASPSYSKPQCPGKQGKALIEQPSLTLQSRFAL